MRWRFTLLDRADKLHVIDEPVGWDGTEITIKRDDEGKHGIFFDYAGNDFMFTDLAMALIQDEYEEWGAEGIMHLVIEESCDDGKAFEELYRGRLLFARYNDQCGDECWVKLPLEVTGDTMKLRNRWDQKVDLLANKAFDGSALEAYDKLPFELRLPSKGIYLQNRAVYSFVNPPFTPSIAEVPNVVGTTNASTFTNYAWINIVPQWDKTELAEIGRFTTPSDVEHHFIGSGTNDINPYPDIHRVEAPPQTNDPRPRVVYFDWLVNTPIMVNESGRNNFDAVQKFDLDVSFSLEITQRNAQFRALYVIVVIVRKNGTHDYLDKLKLFNQTVVVLSSNQPPLPWPAPTNTVNYTKQFSNVVMNEGDHLFVCLPGQVSYVVSLQNGIWQAPDLPAYDITSKGGYVKATALSRTAPTVTKAFAINEAVSRTAEAITDGAIKGYSAYLGRTDSQPYSHNADGCGSLAAITRGIFIRRQEARNGAPTMPISMKDIWEGLDPIHHLGIGLEQDPARPGFQRLRTEPWQFFYPKRKVLICRGVAEVQRRVVENEHYSTFAFGYQRWEAEEYNGLDEFLTKRLYRTALIQIKNELSKLSRFVASGYAWEITRRKGSEDSKDWRYDGENFIVCLERRNYQEYGPYISIIGADRLTLTAEATFPSWATVGAQVDLTMTDANGVPVPQNTGTYTITSRIITGGVVQVRVTPNIQQPMLFGFVTVRQQGVNVLAVEQGRILTPQNIIDPATIYNYRISPVRNALRWLDKVLASYKKALPSNSIYFTDGDGNTAASGELDSTFCKWESGPLSEREDLTALDLADPAKATPLLKPERVRYEYPLSVREFKRLLNDPYGLIMYESSCEVWGGWIDEIKYRPEEGKADFELIPAFSLTQDDLNLRQGLATEQYNFIENENDQIIYTEP